MTDEAFPPFTERPPETEVWRRARADYLTGDSAPVVSERYGLSERSLRRRASVEGWRRCDVEADVSDNPRWTETRPPRRTDYIADNPEYRELADARDADAFGLLFSPRTAMFRQVAFRRAAEGAAMDRPADAAAWLRVLRLLDRCDVPGDLQDKVFSPPDHLRAAFLRAMDRRDAADLVVDALQDDDPEEDDDNPGDEIGYRPR